MPGPQSQLLDIVEEALVRHSVFGDSGYIHDQYQISTDRRLGVIAEGLPSAGRLRDALTGANAESRYRACGNTVIRSAVQHAHTQVEAGTPYGLPLADCDRIFDAAALHLERGGTGTPFESGTFRLHRLGPEPCHGWVWREDYPDDTFGRAFRFLVKQNYGDPLCRPSDEDLAGLTKGEQLLRTLMPLLAPSALSHTQLVGLFPHAGSWKDKASSSQIRIGGSVFLSRSLMSDPWVVAEHLLHEALHQKLYDFRHGHTLLEPAFAMRGAPRVRAPWNAEGLNDANHWDAHRALAAFHVYVQLAVLAQRARLRATELADRYGPPDGMIESRKAFERAWYLGEQLRSEAWSVLGLAGQRMVDWLMSVLGGMEPSPPPPGASLHLTLDLYQREAKKVAWAIGASDRASPALIRKLEPLAKAEVETTRQVLSAIGAADRLDGFEADLAEVQDDDFGLKFFMLRGLIGRTLRGTMADGYTLPSAASGAEDPDALVRRMVVEGSRNILVALQRIPDAVAAARRRAHDMRFTVSCVDEVGRLLSVLAAAAPKGGRILEIGTGVGVGLGWICAGLGRRTDVEVVSIEIDRELSEAARAWAWPGRVRIMTADAVDLLPTLGAFDLVFVDASPVKHGQMEPAIRALRPGGVLVIDDLHTDMSNYEVQKAHKDALRELVLGHPALQALELDWASGVILAVRTKETADEAVTDVSAPSYADAGAA